MTGSDTTDSREGETMWTKWFNEDKPWTGSGDFETVGRIQENYKICNEGQEIVGAQCRRHGFEKEFFDEHTPLPDNPDVLLKSCTTDGLVCRNEDQSLEQALCGDYSIRFRCRYTGEKDDTDSFFPQFDVRIYIILAVVPILIFLIRILWAYVYRRRRQRRRNERRARRRFNRTNSDGDDIDDDSSSIASGLANPPPSYQQLFGESGARSSVFSISRDNIPICAKCKGIPCSVASVVGPGSPVSSEAGSNSPTDATGIYVTTNLSNSHSELSTAGTSTPALPTVSVSSQEISAGSGNSQSADSANSGNIYSEIYLGETSSTHVDTPTTSSQQGGDTRVGPNNKVQLAPSNSVTPGQGASSKNSNLSTLSVSTSEADTENISQPCACACHRTIPFRHEGVSGYENQGFTYEDENSRTVNGRHLPGMHMPVLGLHRVWSNLSNSSVITMTELPSYEAALELMKKGGKAEPEKTSQ